MVEKAFYVKCPYCDDPVRILYSETMPNIRSGCLTSCDSCGEAFCLISTDTCRGCEDWLECAKYSFVDAIAELTREGLIEYDVKNYKRIVK